ncbi:hypothetical protein [Tsukamurella soli]|uniref:DUF4352 domain-containing protein n=1 Tax=Tsukamurella soli TaxID=644556 RepID=A0ABP8J6S2_9ACTN
MPVTDLAVRRRRRRTWLWVLIGLLVVFFGAGVLGNLLPSKAKPTGTSASTDAAPPTSSTAPSTSSTNSSTGSAHPRPDSVLRTAAAPASTAGRYGPAKAVTEADAATATVALNSITWEPQDCAGALPCLVVEVTIRGTGSKPFAYSESAVTAAYPDQDDSVHGGDPTVDYTAIGKMPPLRIGTVIPGRTVHGYVAVPLGSREPEYTVQVADPGDPTRVLASWDVRL